MKKVGAVRSVVCSILVLLLCVTSFTGCGKKNDAANSGGNETSVEPGKVDKNQIFKAEKIDGILAQGERIVCMECIGDRIKAFVSTEEEKDRCISFKPDGSDVQTFDVAIGEDYHSQYCTFDKDGNLFLNCFYEHYNGAPTEESSDEASDAASATEDASPEVIDDSSKGGKAYIIKIDSSGKELFKAELPEELTEDPFLSITAMEWTEKNGLVLCTPRGIETYDEKNGFNVILDEKALGGSYDGFGTLFKDSDDRLYYEGNGEFACCEVDFANKSLGEPLKGFEDSMYEFFRGADHNLYVKSFDGIFTYDSDQGKLEKILDYDYSNIGSGQWTTVGCAVALSDKEIIADVPVDYNSELNRLTKVDPKDVPDRTLITMSAMNMDMRVESQIMDFNRTNDKYRIEVTKHYDYQDDFNNDVVSGNLPDIIMVSGIYSDMYSDFGKCVDKGLFLDLTKEFEKGGAFGDIEMLPNIAEMMKTDDKYYSVIPSFAVVTYAMREQDAGGKTSMSYKDCEEMAKSHNFEIDKAFGGMIKKDNLVAHEWKFNKNKYIDWENSKCDFDNQDFIEFLNFVNKFPVESDDYPKDGESFMNPDFKYANGEALFRESPFSNMDSYIELKQGIFKDNVTLIGYPSKDGENLSYIMPIAFAVNSKTANKEGACEFIRNLFDIREGQYNEVPYAGFPADKSRFEAELERSTKEFSGDSESDYFYFGDKIKKKPLSQEEVNGFKDFVLAIDTRYESDDEVGKIISEECASFFSGKKTAEEVAGLIQNRVSVYVNENS